MLVQERGLPGKGHERSSIGVKDNTFIKEIVTRILICQGVLNGTLPMGLCPLLHVN